ncbi:hypothetical protein AAC387_Pa02g2072 [Persea americana]
MSTPGEVTSQSPSCVKSQRGLDLSPIIRSTLTKTKTLAWMRSELKTASFRSKMSLSYGSNSNSRRREGLGAHFTGVAMPRVLHPGTARLLQATGGT